MILGWGGAGGYPGGYPVGGGILGPIGPGTGAGAGGNTTTDASGNQWVMSSDGQWVPAGSAYGQGLLGDARLFPAQQYDSSGAYVGFEGSDVAQNVQHGSGEGFGVLEKYFAQPSYVGDDPSVVDLGIPTYVGDDPSFVDLETPTYVGDDPSFVDLEPSVVIDMNLSLIHI